MLILKSAANEGARTISGLWKFKNREKHSDGLTFDDLCDVGSQIATRSSGFPGNLFNVYAILSEDGELAFRFGYQPNASQRDVSADALQQQFADFFAKHTQTFLGWKIFSDETPEVKAQVAPLPRRNGFWNNLPKEVSSNNKKLDGNSVLAAWGLRGWGSKLPATSGDYIGWQRVELPQGWTIRLEGHDFILVDNYNQVRGEIDKALVPKVHGATNVDLTTTNPCLLLRTSISVHASFNLGENGPYSYWAENAAGEHLFGIYRQPVPGDECKKRLPKLRRRIHNWLKKNYPDWQDHTAYWDVFPPVHAKWAEAEGKAYSAAVEILKGKSDKDLHALRAKIGIGEQRTDFTLALQVRLSEYFGEEPPYRVARVVVQKMIDILSLKIGPDGNESSPDVAFVRR